MPNETDETKLYHCKIQGAVYSSSKTTMVHKEEISTIVELFGETLFVKLQTLYDLTFLFTMQQLLPLSYITGVH